MTAFFGMRGTGDWVQDQRELSWREGLLLLWPNGDVPLTAILSKGRSESLTDPQFNYWAKNLEAQCGAIAGIFDEPALTTVTTGAQTAGAVKYAKLDSTIAAHMRPGHVVHTLLETDRTKTANWKVLAKVINGANSYLTLSLIKSIGTGITNVVNFIDIVGNANPEGGIIPESVGYDPKKYSNFSQIFRTPLDITRTAKKTRLRTGDAYTELKREALLYHGIEMEMAIIAGVKAELVGANNKPERYTQGIVDFLAEHQPGNIVDFRADSNLTWLTGGEDWFDDKLELLMREGSGEVMALCGNGALRGIQRLAKASGQFQLTADTAAYGIKVVRWTTPFGDIYLKRHPLFTKKTYRHNDILFLRPQNIIYRYIDDTTFKPDTGMDTAGHNATDGQKEEYLTECGWEYHHPSTFMYASGVGLDG